MTETVSCDHKYVFLRQVEKNIGYDRNPTWEISDVFFCEHCLTHVTRKVRTEQPGIESFKRRVIWAAPEGEHPP